MRMLTKAAALPWGLIDSYSETNQNDNNDLGSDADTACGQAILLNKQALIGSTKLYLKKFNLSSPTGNAVSKIYRAQGTIGLDAVPITSTVLATSDTFDVSTLSDSYQLITFTFSPSVWISNSKITVVIEYSGGGGGAYVSVGIDTSSTTHPGNYVRKNSSGTWMASSTFDAIFYLYSS